MFKILGYIVVISAFIVMVFLVIFALTMKGVVEFIGTQSSRNY